MAKTLKELAERALAVQDACNLSGVVHSFSTDIADLRQALQEENPHYSTDQLNHHPICKLWADKIAHLTGTQGKETWGALEICKQVHKLAKGE